MHEPGVPKPEPGEYDPYYASYVERVPAGRVIETLHGQEQELSDLLAGLDEQQAGFRYAADKWSIKQVVGHVIDSERVFAYRALAIARGDRTPLPGFDQNAYVEAGRFDERSLGDLVAEYRSVRQATRTLVDTLQSDDWGRNGHANGVDVSLRAMVYIIAGHQAHHTAVLRERYLGGLA